MFLMKVLILFVALIGVGLAITPPRAPLAGTYTFEVSSSDKNAPYVGGMVIYDFTSGYYRLDTWSSAAPTPGIDGVSIWDYRENPPTVTVVDDLLKCYSLKMDLSLSPAPFDFNSFSFSGFVWWNRALVEVWKGSLGEILYADVFSRDIKGLGNTNASSAYTYNILKWDDKPPSGTKFLFPNTMNCQQLAPADGAHVHELVARRVHPNAPFANPIQCSICKKGIGLIKGRVCQIAGAAACAPFPPAVPYCGIIAGLICAAVPANEAKVCQVIRQC